MKKYIIIILTFVLILSLSLSSMSASISESILVYRNTVKLEVNGEKVDIDNFLYNGTTYIPLRAVSQLLDKNVGWNYYTNVASINEKHYEVEELSKLFPDTKGVKWIYNGFAEYSHEMSLENIINNKDSREYIIKGEAGDPSSGESKTNRNIDLKYTILDNKILQEKVESAMLDSKFDSITLIQTPLVAGTQWTDDLMDKEGKRTTMNSFIEKVEINSQGKKQYTIKYKDMASEYYEIRVIEEGKGIIKFEKLLELKDSSFPVSYSLFKLGAVNKIGLNLYFGDKNADKLYLERRNIEVINLAVARASILALIEGPKTNLIPSMPVGTKLLGINLKNGICTVNFSKEFILNHSGGSAGELLTLYSIVNTLTEFKTINSVAILVEGQAGKTLGNIILDKPLKRNIGLIKK